MKIGRLLICILLLTACSEEDEAALEANRFLYVASGTCYAGGGNTAFTNATASNVVYRVNLRNGQKDITLADYNSSPATVGDSPVGVVEFDANNVYVAVENTTTVGARRIERAPKTQMSSRSLFSNNTAALSAQLRSLEISSTGDLLISKSTAIEKISSANVRITKGANPYVNAPAAPCATSTTLISKSITLTNQFIAFTHAATAQNRIGFVKPAGYAAGGDCTVAQAAPNANSFPVAIAYDALNTNLIVAYAGSTVTTDINSIYVYTLAETDTTVAITATNKIYDVADYPTTYSYLLYGISDMIFDSAENTLYIATAINTTPIITNFSIEKFSYDPSKLGTDNSRVLIRSSNTPFYNYGSDTKCISDMMISN